MPTIKDKIYFNYDGVSSRDFNILSVNLDSGMYEETFGASISIEEKESKWADKNYFFGVRYEPLEFPLYLAFDGKFTDEKLDEIIMWLFKERYRPLFFEGDGRKVIYYCMPVGESSLVHVNNEGYLKINMRCDRYYGLSDPNYSSTLTVSKTSPMIARSLVVNNGGHLSTPFELSIKRLSGTAITHIDLRINSYYYRIENIYMSSEIYLNTEKGIIESSLVSDMKYDDISLDLLDVVLKRGLNTIELLVYGDEDEFQLECRHRNRYRF